MKNHGKIWIVFVVILILGIIADFLLFRPGIPGTDELLSILLLNVIIAVLCIWIVMRILKKEE